MVGGGISTVCRLTSIAIKEVLGCSDDTAFAADQLALVRIDLHSSSKALFASLVFLLVLVIHSYHHSFSVVLGRQNQHWEISEARKTAHARLIRPCYIL